MPNHVTNRVVVTGKESDIVKLQALVLGKDASGETVFDFNTVIPMPEDIRNTESSSIVDEGLAILGYDSSFSFRDAPVQVTPKIALRKYMDYSWAKEKGINTVTKMKEHLLQRNPDCVEKARKALRNLKKYGHKDWYGWSVAEWGTKWNAYEYREASRTKGRWEFLFDTAWSVPEPVFCKLAEMFPTLTIVVRSFDEGWCFASTMLFSKGVLDRKAEYSENNKRQLKRMYERVYGYPFEEDDEEEEEEEDDEDTKRLFAAPFARAVNIILPGDNK